MKRRTVRERAVTLWAVEVRQRNYEPWEALYFETSRSDARFMRRENAAKFWPLARVVKYEARRAAGETTK